MVSRDGLIPNSTALVFAHVLLESFGDPSELNSALLGRLRRRHTANVRPARHLKAWFGGGSAGVSIVSDA